jgi:uncharacterized protein YndB with AHSA1/START domain
MSNKTTVTAEPNKQELFITREFDAPREMVFKVFTTPDFMAQWLGPKDTQLIFDYYEAGSGGKYRYYSKDEHGNEWGFQGVIHEVTAPERAIQTFEFEGLPERGHVSLETATFEVLPGGRTKVTIQSVFKSVADRDGIVMSGMERGVTEGFEKMDDILTGLLQQSN